MDIQICKQIYIKTTLENNLQNSSNFLKLDKHDSIDQICISFKVVIPIQ